MAGLAKIDLGPQDKYEADLEQRFGTFS